MRSRMLFTSLLSFVAFAGDAQELPRVPVTQAMVEAATAMLATVAGGPTGIETTIGFERGKNLALSLDDAARLDWTYWPTERVGVPLDVMSAEQRKLTHALLTATLSARGYLNVMHIMQLEQILALLDTIGFPRGVGHYELVVFGTPSLVQPWAWRFEGHHVSLNVTVSPAGVRVTPTFLGTNPGEVRSGPLTGFRALGSVEDLGRELATSLSDSQKRVALVSAEAPRDIMTGNLGKEPSQWEAWRAAVQPAGIAVRDLNEVQQHWVRRMLDEVVGVYRADLTAPVLSAIDIGELRFAWMGSLERGAPHYFRLQGGDFVFEYDNVQDNANHVHSVWRDKAQDFGRDLLGEHYRAAHGASR